MSDRVLLGVADARDLHIPWHRKYLSVLVMFALQNKPAAWEAFARATRPAWSAAVADAAIAVVPIRSPRRRVSLRLLPSRVMRMAGATTVNAATG